MTFAEWTKAHVGRALDYDGDAGAQCIDLAKYYLDEMYGLKPGAWGDAKYWFKNYLNIQLLRDNFERIPNTPSFVPKKGDIGVFDGKFGHICICDGKGSTSCFYSYDQNFGKPECQRIKHNYTNFLGVLRYTGKDVLETDGLHTGNSGVGVYALKRMLMLAKKVGLTTHGNDANGRFGKGTEEAVNGLLASWGYRETGIAGTKFVSRLYKELGRHIK